LIFTLFNVTFHDVFRASEFVSQKSHGSRTRMKKSAIPGHGEDVFEVCLASKRYKYNWFQLTLQMSEESEIVFQVLGPFHVPRSGLPNVTYVAPARSLPLWPCI